jgi:hypothetical protein
MGVKSAKMLSFEFRMKISLSAVLGSGSGIQPNSNSRDCHATAVPIALRGILQEAAHLTRFIGCLTVLIVLMCGDRVRFAGGAVTVLVKPICVAAATPAQTLRLLYQTLEHFRWLHITELRVVRPSFVLNAGLCTSFGYSKVKQIWSVTSLHWSLISVSRR